MLATVSVDKYSFPSGHTTRATYCALFVPAHVLGGGGGRATAAAVLAWAAATGVSRITLGGCVGAFSGGWGTAPGIHVDRGAGRHHVLDVVAGLVVGGALYAVQANTGLLTVAALPVAWQETFQTAKATIL